MTLAQKYAVWVLVNIVVAVSNTEPWNHIGWNATAWLAIPQKNNRVTYRGIAWCDSSCSFTLSPFSVEQTISLTDDQKRTWWWTTFEVGNYRRLKESTRGCCGGILYAWGTLRVSGGGVYRHFQWRIWLHDKQRLPSDCRYQDSWRTFGRIYELLAGNTNLRRNPLYCWYVTVQHHFAILIRSDDIAIGRPAWVGIVNKPEYRGKRLQNHIMDALHTRSKQDGTMVQVIHGINWVSITSWSICRSSQMPNVNQQQP